MGSWPMPVLCTPLSGWGSVFLLLSVAGGTQESSEEWEMPVEGGDYTVAPLQPGGFCSFQRNELEPSQAV